MELTPLRYFVKLADVLSFTEAARELFVTQSTLSQSIKQLEGELGTALFDRVGKKVYLTDSGLDEKVQEAYREFSCTVIRENCSSSS